MKQIITLFALLICAISITAQVKTQIDPQVTVPERTPELENLYAQAKYLETYGNAASINANRLAIKAAWQSVNTEVSALYKPMETNAFSAIGDNGTTYIATEIKERPEIPANRDWDPDMNIRDGFVDGLDMQVTTDGDIYIAMFENKIDAGGSEDIINVFKSTDNGISFSLWKEETSLTPIRKMELVLLDGVGDEFALIFMRFENNLFQVMQLDFATATSVVTTIATEVLDFGVDRNFPENTENMQCFIVYEKLAGSCQNVFSARSAAGSYGLSWIDEYDLNFCGSQIEFAYGAEGATYLVATSASYDNLYTSANSNFNDPASWESIETVINGLDLEYHNPTIRASRKPYSQDEVLIAASTRYAGTTNRFDLFTLKRENGNPYEGLISYPSNNNNQDLIHPDMYVRKVAGSNEIRRAWVYDVFNNNAYGSIAIDLYVDPLFNTAEYINPNRNTTDQFAISVAETIDNEPCMVYAGAIVQDGFGLYFNRRSEILGVEDISKNEILFYPNPTNDLLNVTSKQTIDQISIYSVLGKKVVQISPQERNIEINLTTLSQGVYVMKLISEGKTSTHKIVKK